MCAAIPFLYSMRDDSHNVCDMQTDQERSMNDISCCVHTCTMGSFSSAPIWLSSQGWLKSRGFTLVTLFKPKGLCTDVSYPYLWKTPALPRVPHLGKVADYLNTHLLDDRPAYTFWDLIAWKMRNVILAKEILSPVSEGLPCVSPVGPCWDWRSSSYSGPRTDLSHLGHLNMGADIPSRLGLRPWECWQASVRMGYTFY